MAAFSPTMAMNMVVHPLQRHIKEIKRRLLVVGATIMVFFVVAFSYSGLLIEWFKRPFEDDLIFYAPAEALFASIKISFLAAIVVSRKSSDGPYLSFSWAWGFFCWDWCSVI
jgi:Sec-independent protein secretion pathway component TatC